MNILLTYYIIITNGNVKMYVLFLKYNFSLLLEEPAAVAKLRVVSQLTR